MSETVENTPPLCPKCKSARTARIKRIGVMQIMVLHLFGLYPWECGSCRKEFLFKSRGRLKRKRRSTGEVHLPPVG
jgi:ribosomal protein L37AE/L43A